MELFNYRGFGSILFIHAGPPLPKWDKGIVPDKTNGVPKHAQSKRANWKGKRGKRSAK